MKSENKKQSSGEGRDDSGATQKPNNVRWGKSLFAASVFVSAFLLFQIQPLISKTILPWFGGTPSVWTTCMLFFQILLCGGYAYSHLLTARLTPKWQGLVHASLLIVSLAFLNIVPSIEWKPIGSESPVLRITLLLLATVGLPYFILSTTGPLLLRWFSLAEPNASPYRLYSLSNAGSLLALLSYPLVFEPMMRISTQATTWSVGFLAFVALCLGCASRLWKLPSRQESSERNPSTSGKSRPVTVRMYAIWFSLAMVASWMLLAETNEICQDVAVIPFLWVVPLSMYLLSFILCFESDRWYRRSWYALGTAGFVLAVCWLQSFGTRMFLPVQLCVYFGSLFCIFMMCHGELARLKPNPKNLTVFYLTMSAGGAGGGLFVGLIAPIIFPSFWEHYLGQIATCVISLVVYFDHRGWTVEDNPPPTHWKGLAILVFVGVGTVFAATISNYTASIAMVRNFYGVLEVETDDVEDAIVLRHGRIMHGLQLKGIPSLPTMYYGFKTGVGRAIEELREQNRPLNIGLVGLGIGTLAAYGQADDTFRFYEINDNVTQLAQQHFTFLKNCPSQVDIISGDARLVLEDETPKDFDLLVLDAFSGDAVPAHLLTKEAMQVYLRHLQPDGLMAFHISNIHFDLRRVTDALADVSGLQAITLETAPAIDSSTGMQSLTNPGSRWVLMARSSELLQRPRYQEAEAKETLSEDRRVLWTDDFSNLIEVLDW